MIDARSLARALGGEVSGNTVRAPGPGHSRHDRSLSVTIRDGDFIVHSFADDDWRECRDHVRAAIGVHPFDFREQARGAHKPAVYVVDSDTGANHTMAALAIWREARPIGGTPAVAYLASRGLSYQGEELRWHPSCPFGKGQRHGCMVALVRNIVTNEPQAIHRTAIDSNCRKIDRKAFGPIGGGAVKLTDNVDVSTVIAIGEGIETALSIPLLPMLGNMPVWSVLTAGGIATFPALPGIESVWIAADNDASGTGQKSARAAGARLYGHGIETIILTSNVAGSDLNDRVARHG